MTLSHRRSLPLPRYLTSLLTSSLTIDRAFIRVARPPIPHELHLTIPAWAQNPLRLSRLVVFNATPQVISALTVLNMNVPAVANEPPVIRSTAVSGIIAPTAAALPIWPLLSRPPMRPL